MDKKDFSELNEAFSEIESLDIPVAEVRVNHAQEMNEPEGDGESVWGADIRRTNRVPVGYAMAIGRPFRARDQNDDPCRFRVKSIARFKESRPSRKMASLGLKHAHGVNGATEFPTSVRRLAWIIGFGMDMESAQRFVTLSDLFNNEIVDRVRLSVERWFWENGNKRLAPDNPAYSVTRRWRPTDPGWIIHRRAKSRPRRRMIPPRALEPGMRHAEKERDRKWTTARASRSSCTSWRGATRRWRARSPR